MKKKGLILLLLLATSLVVCGSSASQDNEVTQISGLIALYSFDEKYSNKALDTSGNDHHGDISAASRVEGKFGNGLLFGTDNARVKIEDSFTFDQGLITIETWIKPYEIQTGEIYRIIGGYNYHGLDFQIRDGRLEILFDGQSYHYGTATMQIDVWTHIAFTSDGTDIVTYINGIEDSRTNITLPIQSMTSPNIGANLIYSGGSPLLDYVDEFPGIIDEMRIWDIARKSYEIVNDYDQQLINPPVVSIKKIDLTAFYTFNELSGIIAFDTSGNNHHGDITAASRVEGKFGNGLLFGADNARVKIEDSFTFDQGLITIEAWIKPYEIQTGEVYRIIGGYNYHGLDFQIRDGRLEILFDGQSYHYGTATIQIDVWTHIAFTSDGTDIVTYINGIEDSRTNHAYPVDP